MAIVKEVLEKFAIEHECSAIVLKGKWGVGKTHLWDSVIRAKKERLDKSFYSYVSLFGIGSLKDLKQAIYENFRSRNSAVDVGARSTEDLISSGRGLIRRGIKLFSGFKGASPVIDSYQSFAISDALICIDDFERKGSKLSDAEVLGLISWLVEKRNCKVILILNEEWLAKVQGEFKDYREKVFSFEVEYNPTSAQAARLIFNVDDPAEKELVANIVDLDINNVRLLRKIRHYYQYMRSVVGSDNPYLWRDIRSIIPLAVLARYNEAGSPISLADLETFEGVDVSYLTDDASEEEKKAAAEKDEQAQRLTKYGYFRTSDFDREIINLVKKGYLDSEVTRGVVDAALSQSDAAAAEFKFNSAWHMYHNDLSKSQDEMVAVFDDAVNSYLHYMSVDRLGSVARFYRELGMDRRADEIIDRFFVVLGSSRSLNDREDLWDEPSDMKIKFELDRYFDGLVSSMALKDALECLLTKRFTAEALSVLVRSSESDFFVYLTSSEASDYKSIIKFVHAAFHSPDVFNGVVAGSAEKIFFSLYGALLKVKGLSRLNENRLVNLLTLDAEYLQAKSSMLAVDELVASATPASD